MDKNVIEVSSPDWDTLPPGRYVVRGAHDTYVTIWPAGTTLGDVMAELAREEALRCS